MSLLAEEKTPLTCSIYDNLPRLESWYCQQKKDTEQQEEDCLQKLIKRKNNKVVSFNVDPPPIKYYTALDQESFNEKRLDYPPSGCCGGLSGSSLYIYIFIYYTETLFIDTNLLSKINI
jgi:hypothetical protein